MEENDTPWEFRSIEMIINMMVSTQTYSQLPSHPLFSCIITLCVLILLYFPHKFSFRIVFSPVLILTTSLLLSLLRLGANQRIRPECKKTRETRQNPENGFPETEKTGFCQEERKWVACKMEPEPKMQPVVTADRPSFEETFVGWNVRAPLEVIYEEYEGEEDEDDPNERDRHRFIERYPSLSLCYPESDSDTSSEGDFLATEGWPSPAKMQFRWEEEDKEGLIEITLDKRDSEFHGEEENLIEIDIYSTLDGDNFS